MYAGAPVTAEPGSYSLRIFCRVWTHNTERRIHYHQRSDWGVEVRQAAKITALAAKIPKLGSVRYITVTAFQRRGPLADAAAFAPAAKAAIDGLVDAKVLDDDDPKHVKEIRFRPPERAESDREIGLLLELGPE